MRKPPLAKRWKNLAGTITLLALSLPVFGEGDSFQDLGKYLRQHGYGVMSVDNRGDNRQMVVAKINGHDVSLLVDTGCSRTLLTAECARNLKLQVKDQSGEVWGAGGEIKGHGGEALVSSFTLDGYEINRTNLISVLSRSARLYPGADGALGLDFLHLNAVILPVGGRVFLFKPGNGPVPSIDSYLNALGYKSIPLHEVKGGLRIEGRLNGHPLTALVDGGAMFSAFNLDYVRQVSGGEISYDGITMRGFDGRETPTYIFSPKNLELAPSLTDTTPVGTCESPSFKQSGFDAFLGFDLLARHQSILDLAKGVLWMK